MNKVSKLLLKISLLLTVTAFFVHQMYTLHESSTTFDDELLMSKTESPLVTTDEDDRIIVDASVATSSILFLGDILLARNVELLSELHGLSYPTQRLLGLLPPADAVVANFESAMAVSHVRTRAYTMQFSTPTWMLPVLQDLGVTHVSLANNHSLDFGRAGHERAKQELAKVGIVPFGKQQEVATSSIVVIDGEVRVGIIAINAVFIDPSISAIRTQLETLNESTAVQVAYVHWGDEYVLVHNENQVNIATQLVTLGIDAVIGHHPHVVQDIQLISGVPVFYSLGNFLFDQYFSTAVQEGYMVLMTANSEKNLSFNIIPVTSEDVRSQPRLMNESEKTNFLQGLAERSDERLQTAINNGLLRFEVSLAEDTETGMIQS